MQSLIRVIQPELILIAVAGALFLLGTVNRAAARRFSAWVALVALAVVFVIQLPHTAVYRTDVWFDASNVFRVAAFASFIKTLAAGVGMLFVLLAWPTDDEASGNPALHVGTEAGEFFALMLLSIAGVMVVAGANDIILLFLGIELAAIPTYIMVSVSRPLPAAQEAGVKYFFLGAMAAAVMLFGFSYLYGTTGLTSLSEMAGLFAASVQSSVPTTAPAGQVFPDDLAGPAAVASLPPGVLVTLSSWQMLAVVMLIAGFAFKMAAVPLHFYAGDVYQGAATPVTALLSFVPKASGFVALIKLLYVVGGGEAWAVPEQISKLLWVLAVLTMTVGNVLGLLQQNVKRVLAYSSIAHSGYMLVGVATLVSASGEPTTQHAALRAVLFYLAAYGIMNAAAFGVLMMLPAKPLPAWDRRPATGSAETFDDIAGAGIRHVGLGLCMAVACFSLIGIPTTVGFFGKFYLIQSAWRGGMTWLIIIMMINAAISAGYYLRIVGTMFLKPEPIGGIELAPTSDSERQFEAGELDPRPERSLPILSAIAISCAATLLFGTLLPAIELLDTRAATATNIDRPAIAPPAAPTEERAGTTDRSDLRLGLAR